MTPKTSWIGPTKPAQRYGQPWTNPKSLTLPSPLEPPPPDLTATRYHMSTAQPASLVLQPVTSHPEHRNSLSPTPTPAPTNPRAGMCMGKGKLHLPPESQNQSAAAGDGGCSGSRSSGSHSRCGRQRQGVANARRWFFSRQQNQDSCCVPIFVAFSPPLSLKECCICTPIYSITSP